MPTPTAARFDDTDHPGYEDFAADANDGFRCGAPEGWCADADCVACLDDRCCHVCESADVALILRADDLTAEQAKALGARDPSRPPYQLCAACALEILGGTCPNHGEPIAECDGCDEVRDEDDRSVHIDRYDAFDGNESRGHAMPLTSAGGRW